MSVAHSDDHGSVTLETAIVFPGLLLVVLLFFQFGLTAYAHHVTSSAAHDAAAVAAVSGPGAGQSAGAEILQSIDSITTGVSMSVASATQEQVTMVGEAQVMSLFPGFHITVKASGSSVVERFRSEGER